MAPAHSSFGGVTIWLIVNVPVVPAALGYMPNWIVYVWPAVHAKSTCEVKPQESSLQAMAEVVGQPEPPYTATLVSPVAPPHKDRRALPV